MWTKPLAGILQTCQKLTCSLAPDKGGKTWVCEKVVKLQHCWPMFLALNDFTTEHLIQDWLGRMAWLLLRHWPFCWKGTCIFPEKRHFVVLIGQYAWKRNRVLSHNVSVIDKWQEWVWPLSCDFMTLAPRCTSDWPLSLKSTESGAVLEITDKF